MDMKPTKLQVEWKNIGRGKIEMNFAVFHQIMGYLDAQPKIELHLKELK